jgi:hypothetical protein
MIDTGMNRPESIEAMRAGIESLAVDLDRTDFFITHGHSDHVGLVSELKTGPSRIFLHPADAAIVLDPQLWSNLARSAHVHGFPDADTAVGKHPGKKYLFTGRPEFTCLREGDTLSVGRYFRCVETPGHTPDIFASLSRRRDLLSGTILGNITQHRRMGRRMQIRSATWPAWIRWPPTVSDWSPGHLDPIMDHRRRIEELKPTTESDAGNRRHPRPRLRGCLPGRLADDRIGIRAGTTSPSTAVVRHRRRLRTSYLEGREMAGRGTTEWHRSR